MYQNTIFQSWIIPGFHLLGVAEVKRSSKLELEPMLYPSVRKRSVEMDRRTVKGQRGASLLLYYRLSSTEQES